MNNVFERVYLINLKRRPDRLAAALEALRTAAWPFRAPEVFEAIDGHTVPLRKDWESGGPAWGCALSHLTLLKRCIDESVEPVLILEDDLAFRSTFRADCERFLAALPSDWEGLWFGGNWQRAPIPVNSEVVRCLGRGRTHAYAARGQFLRALYAYWSRPEQTVHIDWTVGGVQKNHRVYSPTRSLINQSRSRSDINGALNPAKSWETPTGHEPIILLDCDRETMEGLREFCIHTGYDRGEDGIDNGLRRVFQGKDMKGALRQWIRWLQEECISCEGMVLGVWHPQATAELLRECWKGRVHVVRSVDDAIPLLACHDPKRLSSAAGSWNPLNAPETVLDA